jgi:phosphorylcholine metabolism protein LicD
MTNQLFNCLTRKQNSRPSIARQTKAQEARAQKNVAIFDNSSWPTDDRFTVKNKKEELIKNQFLFFDIFIYLF